MSTIAPTQPRPVVTSVVSPDWLPGPLYRMSVEQYDALAEAGVLTKKDNVHLINGYLVEKMTHKPPHATADELCGAELNRVIPPGYHVRQGKPVRLPSVSSEPEPDRSVVRGSVRDYSGRHPGPSDTFLIIDVSKSSLEQDRAMATIYGSAGIPYYWIINLIDGQLEVYSNPGPTGYRSLEVLAPPHILRVVIDDQEVGEIRVADILP
jgi:Uma2 family endonuclease